MKGFSCSCDHLACGAVWVPFGAAKVKETQASFFFTKSVGVGAQGEFGVGVSELRRDPYVTSDDQMATPCWDLPPAAG